MTDFLSYLFWPNPANATYGSPKAIALLIVCALLVLGSFGLSYWRRKMAKPDLRRVSKSWSSALFWFGLIGVILVVARVEQIQYISMRFMWLAWAIAAVMYVILQIKHYRARYYEVLPATSIQDPRSKYLPKRKKK